MTLDGSVTCRSSVAASFTRRTGGARYLSAWTVLADGTRVAPGQIRSSCAGRIVDETSRASGVNQAERDFWNREPICSRIE